MSARRQWRSMGASGVGLALVVLACARRPSAVALEGQGVRARRDADEHALATLTAGSLELTMAAGDRTDALRGIASISRDHSGAQGPIGIEVIENGRALPRGQVQLTMEAGRPVALEPILGHQAELVTSIDPKRDAVIVSLRVHAAETLGLRLSLPRSGSDVAVEDGAQGGTGWAGAEASPSASAAATTPNGVRPESAGARASLPPTRTHWLAVQSRRPLMLAAPTPVTAFADDQRATVDAAAGGGEVAITLGAEGASAFPAVFALAQLPVDDRAVVSFEVEDARTGAALDARVVVEAYPDAAPTPPIVWDPSRHAERTSPVFDVLGGRASLRLPPGKYTFRTMHGVAWSIDRQTRALTAGERSRIASRLERQGDWPAFVGCDFHVHAEGSVDAREVTYADRVKNLLGAGVECAAATEHDFVGDHGPAAKLLGAEGRLRALPGVELTSESPRFGHFNVYPWPSGAGIPHTHGTTPGELFTHVHELPGDFVFQLNHPRLSTGDGHRIGYFDLVGLDPATGKAVGPLGYRGDYDAIEVFNGYQMDDLAGVRRGIEEWLAMAVRGEWHVATGNSDSHKIWYPWAGFPRTYVEAGDDWRAKGRPSAAIVDALKHGRAFVTNGPLVRVSIGDARMGDSVRWSSGLTADVDVELADWQSSPKLEVYQGTARSDCLLAADPKRPRHWIGRLPLGQPTKRTPVVAVVEATLSDDGKIVMAVPRALGFTNPVWLAP
jgi:hypothetical protein